MRDGQDGAVGECRSDRGLFIKDGNVTLKLRLLRRSIYLNEIVRFQVNRRSCLVKDKDLGLPQESTSKAHQLALPNTQVLTTFGYVMIRSQ